MTFFTGYLAQGTGGVSGFTENTATGYARQPVTMSSLVNGNCSLAAPVVTTAQAATTVTQRALYDAQTGGNLIMWWSLSSPPTIQIGGVDQLKTGALSHTFPALYNGAGTGAQPVDFLTGTKVGTTVDGSPIYAGHYIEVVNGTVAAKSSV